MKHLWVKTSTEVFEDGGKSIQYTCEDFPGVFVYSNAVYIPHTYDNGRWLYRSFAIETPLGFLAKEFRTLREAKAFVESGQLEKAIKAKRIEKAIKAERPALAEGRRTCDG